MYWALGKDCIHYFIHPLNMPSFQIKKLSGEGLSNLIKNAANKGGNHRASQVIWLLNPSFSPRKTRAGSLVD
jgi:hypothetical protein